MRDLTADNLGDCVALYVDVFNAPPWHESWETEDARRRLEDLLGAPRSLGVCLINTNGELLGFALGHLERSGAEDHFLLQEMCVHQASQRAGHGAALLTALQERLPGVEHWYLLTARESAAAAFYQKNGFRPAGRMAVFVRP